MPKYKNVNKFRAEYDFLCAFVHDEKYQFSKALSVDYTASGVIKTYLVLMWR